MGLVRKIRAMTEVPLVMHGASDLPDELYPKVKSNLEEVQARGGKVIALTRAGLDLHVDHAWEVPDVWGAMKAFMLLPALQLFAYEMADYLGKDVDQPRNLAKSVTVE